MKHINRVGEFGQVDDPECAVHISNPDFPHPWAYRVHWFPIVGISTALHLIELMACVTPSREREFAQVVQCATAKPQWFRIDHIGLYKNLYEWKAGLAGKPLFISRMYGV